MLTANKLEKIIELEDSVGGDTIEFGGETLGVRLV